MINILIWVLVAYIILTGVLFGCQRSLLYHPDQTIPDPHDFGLGDVSPVRIESAGGHRLLGWWRSPKTPTSPVMIYFHGNAGHLGHRSEKIRPYLAAGYGLLLVSYRYNAKAGGTPSEEGLYSDGRATIDFVRRKGVADDRIVVYGESLGTGVAVTVAAENNVGAVVLESPYTSIANVAQKHYWYLPTRLLVLDKFDVVEKIRRIGAPLLIVHGERDTIIPASFGRGLFDKALEPKELSFISGAGHNNLYEYGAAQIITDFISRSVGTTGP